MKVLPRRSGFIPLMGSHCSSNPQALPSQSIPGKNFQNRWYLSHTLKDRIQIDEEKVGDNVKRGCSGWIRIGP